MTADSNVRATAARLLHAVAFGGRSLDRVLADAQATDRDRPLLQEMTIGSIRHYFSLSDEIDSRLNGPHKARDSIVLCLLIVGLYQLRHTRIPAYAAVSESVDATRRIGRPWARGLVNQVLRAAAEGTSPMPSDDVAKWDHPRWLLDAIRDSFPQDWRAIVSASLSRAPLALRVNLRAQTREQYQNLLSERGVSANFGPTPAALILDDPVSTKQLPGFDKGCVSVQDVGAQWAASLLEPNGGEHVLDACAAPGGKALHLLELAPAIELVALDQDEARCEVMRGEFRRLGADPNVVARGDATSLNWWCGVPFQKILLDAPCSGTGTLRRHPDIKLLKHQADLLQYREIQRKLLDNLWRVLARGGRLLYCTCSVLTAENDSVIDDFLARTPDATEIPLVGDWGVATRRGRQLLPELGGPDGFYYAMLGKQ